MKGLSKVTAEQWLNWGFLAHSLVSYLVVNHFQWLVNPSISVAIQEVAQSTWGFIVGQKSNVNQLLPGEIKILLSLDATQILIK